MDTKALYEAIKDAKSEASEWSILASLTQGDPRTVLIQDMGMSYHPVSFMDIYECYRQLAALLHQRHDPMYTTNEALGLLSGALGMSRDKTLELAVSLFETMLLEVYEIDSIEFNKRFFEHKFAHTLLKLSAKAWAQVFSDLVILHENTLYAEGVRGLTESLSCYRHDVVEAWCRLFDIPRTVNAYRDLAEWLMEIK